MSAQNLEEDSPLDIKNHWDLTLIQSRWNCGASGSRDILVANSLKRKPINLNNYAFEPPTQFPRPSEGPVMHTSLFEKSIMEADFTRKARMATSAI